MAIDLKNFTPTKEMLIDVALGKVAGMSIVNKFGRNSAIGTTIAPVCLGGNYRTPTTATALEIVSDNTNDTSDGTGGRKFFIQGLDGDFNLQSETVTMNGTTAVDLANTYTRVFRAYCSESGTYATQSAMSHNGTITIQENGAGDEWLQIDVAGTNMGVGQTQIGAYTIPNGYKALVLGKHFTIDSNKSANMYFFKREGADDTTTPYNTMRLVEQMDGIGVPTGYDPDAPLLFIPSKTDIGFMAKTATGTASISVDFQILLIDENYI